MHKLRVSDIEPGKVDETQSLIDCVYSIAPPLFAIYGTQKRVSIQYADNADLEWRQRSDFATLAPLRGEINGLIDGWRDSDDPIVKSKVQRYDRNVADALVVAVTRDCASAQDILRAIRDELVADRTSRDRLWYLLTAGGSAIVTILLAAIGALIASHYKSQFWGNTDLLWMAAGAGSVGAFFSIAQSLHGRQFKPEQNLIDNLVAAFVRVAIGVIGAVMLVALLKTDMVSVKLGSATIGGCPRGRLTCAPNMLPLLIAAFVAGFVERLVPDLLRGATIGADAAAGGKSTAVGEARPAGAPSPTPLTAATAATLAVPAEPAGDTDTDDHCAATAPVTDGEQIDDADLPGATVSPPAAGGANPVNPPPAPPPPPPQSKESTDTTGDPK